MGIWHIPKCKTRVRTSYLGGADLNKNRRTLR